ncbi:MAG: hypothetical protein ACP5FH_04200, partial [Terracidiphilus sp.]
QTAEDYLVPAGASFSSDVSGTAPVNPATVKPQPRRPLGQRRARGKHPRHKHTARVKPAS